MPESRKFNELDPGLRRGDDYASAYYAFLTNSDFSCMAPKPSILQSIS